MGAPHMSITTSVGGHENTVICQKETVKTKQSHEELVELMLPQNILFLPGGLSFLFIHFMVGIP